MNYSKGFIGILALILIAVLLAGGGYLWVTSNSGYSIDGYLFTRKLATSTTKWKTYKNEQYGFSFRYPSDLGEVVTVRDSVNDDCPEMKTFGSFGEIEGARTILSFSKKPSVGSTGSYVEYRVSVAQKAKTDPVVCGKNLLSLASALTNDSESTSAVFSHQNGIQAYKSTLSTAFNTSARAFYTLFSPTSDTVTVIQPKAIFVPYSGSAEDFAMTARQKNGDKTPILSFVNSGEEQGAIEVRQYLADFEQIVQTFMFTK